MANRWRAFLRTKSISAESLENFYSLQNDYEIAKCLENLLIGRATGQFKPSDKQDYQVLRSYLLAESSLQTLLPSWIRTARDLEQFWQFIKLKFNNYAERRQFIWEEFLPLLNHLEVGDLFPSKDYITQELTLFDSNTVSNLWHKALERKGHDPEGAITSARSLLESVCKHILDLNGIEYDPKKVELPELYKKTAVNLNLHSSQHEDEIFKQILGGCSSIVSGLGTLRNKLGDAHGPGMEYRKKPAPRHAELAVNLAGSMALFLIQTYEFKKGLRKDNDQAACLSYERDS